MEADPRHTREPSSSTGYQACHRPVVPAYAGAVGYFSFNGNLDTCITIRTALIKDGKAYVQAGGGWVNDSTPEGEYQETINKSMAMRKAIAMAESFGKAD